MPVSTDILRTYRGPRRVVRDLLDMGRREDRAVMWLMAGCLLFFVGQMPILQRRVIMGEPPLGAAVPELDSFSQGAIYAFFGAMMILPLLLYLLAPLGGLLARLFGGRPTGFGARTALFWAWLAAAPMGLLYGLAAGMNGPEHPAVLVVGLLWGVVLACFWVFGLIEAGKGGGA